MSAARVSSGARPPARPATRPAVARGSARAAPASPASAGARRVAAAAGRWALATAAWLFRRPVPVLVTVAVIGLTGSIGWNVLMRQSAKHPAPLFGSRAEPQRRAEPAPAASPAFAAPPAVAPLPAPRPAMVAPSVADRPKPDTIGALIRTGEPGRADSERIAAVQTALSKLNFGPLKSDGIMGAGTKAAIERFERERNLPVTGAPSPRTIRALAQQSGMEIE